MKTLGPPFGTKMLKGSQIIPYVSISRTLSSKKPLSLDFADI